MGSIRPIDIIDGKFCKKCSKCKKIKSFDEYHKDKHQSLGLSTSCKECVTDKILKYSYNLKIEEYYNLFEKQEGKCLICNNEFDILSVDHDHKTGEIRGLLCMTCNNGLGCFKDDTEIIKSALNYLINYYKISTEKVG